MSERILVLYTGGTIGMERSEQGYRPSACFGRVLGKHLDALSGLPNYDFIELAPLIDSANLLPTHWVNMAQELKTHWNDYRGFVVVHGTDTLAWTASALSFMLAGADRPVILTGAQIPLLEPRSDALANLSTAMILANSTAYAGVHVFFGNTLLQGNRSTKSSSIAFQAFSSPNAAPLAEVGITLPLLPQVNEFESACDFLIPNLEAQAVAVLTLYPGLAAAQIEALIEPPHVRGLVLCSYGAGNLPDANTELLQALERAIRRGIVVVNTTQCAHGPVIQGAYATSSALERIGVISASDMTLEAAFAKLHILLGLYKDSKVVSEKFAVNWCGEMT